jgi:hypothetical protein
MDALSFSGDAVQRLESIDALLDQGFLVASPDYRQLALTSELQLSDADPS